MIPVDIEGEIYLISVQCMMYIAHIFSLNLFAFHSVLIFGSGEGRCLDIESRSTHKLTSLPACCVGYGPRLMRDIRWWMKGVAHRDESCIVTPTFAITVIRGHSHTRYSNMARPKLTVYLDVVSPFGYMAFYVTRVSALDRLMFSSILEAV